MSPTGIILSSGSQGATEEAITKVLTDNGLEPLKAEPEATPGELVEPMPEDFDNDEAYEKAKEAFDKALADHEEQEAEREEKQAGSDKPKLTRRQKAIERATRDLKEENRKLQERLAALESGAGGKKPAKEAAQPKLEAPKREAFKTDEEFEDAKFEYRYQLRRQKEQSEESLKQAQARVKEVEETYRSNVNKFREGLEVDDWDETLNQSLPLHDAVVFSIAELENGPQVSYYLGKHPDFTKKLATLSPYSAVMEVGKLAASLAGKQKTGAGNRPEAGAGARSKSRVRIPAPVRPVNSSATNSTMTSREAAQQGNFRAFKQAQRARR